MEGGTAGSDRTSENRHLFGIIKMCRVCVHVVEMSWKKRCDRKPSSVGPVLLIDRTLSLAITRTQARHEGMTRPRSALSRAVAAVDEIRGICCERNDGLKSQLQVLTGIVTLVRVPLIEADALGSGRPGLGVSHQPERTA